MICQFLCWLLIWLFFIVLMNPNLNSALLGDLIFNRNNVENLQARTQVLPWCLKTCSNSLFLVLFIFKGTIFTYAFRISYKSVITPYM